MALIALSAETIGQRLDAWLETEFTFHRVDHIAAALALLEPDEQAFILMSLVPNRKGQPLLITLKGKVEAFYR